MAAVGLMGAPRWAFIGEGRPQVAPSTPSFGARSAVQTRSGSRLSRPCPCEVCTRSRPGVVPPKGACSRTTEELLCGARPPPPRRCAGVTAASRNWLTSAFVRKRGAWWRALSSFGEAFLKEPRLCRWAYEVFWNGVTRVQGVECLNGAISIEAVFGLLLWLLSGVAVLFACEWPSRMMFSSERGGEAEAPLFEVLDRLEAASCFGELPIL